MGLDMYLEKHTYIWSDQRKNLTIVGVNVRPERVKTIVEEVGYWRKANAIHQWFVGNVQDGEDDCKQYYVSVEQLKELLGLVTCVLADPKHRGPELLPTQSGFFFGDTEYDEYYVEDLVTTKKICEDCIAEGTDTGSFCYRASW